MRGWQLIWASHAGDHAKPLKAQTNKLQYLEALPGTAVAPERQIALTADMKVVLVDLQCVHPASIHGVSTFCSLDNREAGSGACAAAHVEHPVFRTVFGHSLEPLCDSPCVGEQSWVAVPGEVSSEVCRLLTVLPTSAAAPWLQPPCSGPRPSLQTFTRAVRG